MITNRALFLKVKLIIEYTKWLRNELTRMTRAKKQVKSNHRDVVVDVEAYIASAGSGR